MLPVSPLMAHKAPVANTDQKRAAFLKLIDRPRVEPDATVRPHDGKRAAPGAGAHFDRCRRLAAGHRHPMKSHGATGRLPVVIQLHGTGGSKEQLLPRR